jgi:hypothetical protein
MDLTRVVILILAFGCVSCSQSAPTDLPPAYEEVIRSEWSIAQKALAELSVNSIGLAVPELCTWIPYDGPIETSASWTGFANGVFDPHGFVIQWNTRTPTVIRHEAGHAILQFLDHPCWSCWSVGLVVKLHPGAKCEDTNIGKYCGGLLNGKAKGTS